jgi:hypothetical protein
MVPKFFKNISRVFKMDKKNVQNQKPKITFEKNIHDFDL